MNSQINIQNRLVNIDFLKSIAIFGVVFIHARNDNFFIESLSEMFRFSVPVFIIFFIYFLEKSLSKVDNNKEYFLVLRNRFIYLFAVYIVFTILYFFLLNDLSTIHLRDLITGYWSGYGWSGQYFFIILFQIIIFYPILQWVSKIILKKYKYIYIFILLYIVFYWLLNYFLWEIKMISMISDRILIYWIPYIVIGIALFNKVTFQNKLFNNIFFIVFLVATIPLEFFFLNILHISHSPYIVSTVLISSLVIANYFIVKGTMINNLISDKMKKIIVNTSKRTLGIFVLNPLIIYICNEMHVNLYFSGLWDVFFAILVFSITLLAIEIITYTPLKRLVISS